MKGSWEIFIFSFAFILIKEKKGVWEGSILMPQWWNQVVTAHIIYRLPKLSDM